jgi:hypothetical protein
VKGFFSWLYAFCSASIGIISSSVAGQFLGGGQSRRREELKLKSLELLYRVWSMQTS